MEQFKEISIVIASYNPNKEVLNNLLNSLLNQTHNIVEVLVIDDASKINIEFDHERVRVIRLEKNRGPAFARNIGINKVKTKYIAFIDSDCIPPLNWIERLLHKFDSEIYSGVSGPYGDVPETHTVLMKLENTFFKSLQLSEEQPYNYATTANWVTETEYIRSAGLFKVYKSGITKFNNYFNEDGELATGIISFTKKPILWCPSITVQHHISDKFCTLMRKQIQLVRGILLSNSRNNIEGLAVPTLYKKLIATLPLISYSILPLSSTLFICSLISLIISTNISFHRTNIKVLPVSILFHLLIIHTWAIVGISTILEIILVRFFMKAESINNKNGCDTDHH